jgi:hypothetical protein
MMGLERAQFIEEEIMSLSIAERGRNSTGAAIGLGIAFGIALFVLLAAVVRADDDNAMVAEFSLLSGNHAAFGAPGAGYQVYRCTSTNGAYAWLLNGVDAKLLDDEGKTFATQSLDAFTAFDGSHINAAVSKSGSGAPGNLPDLLYATGPKGVPGIFFSVTYVVRTAATGGQPPVQACDASIAGRSIRVPFKAEYTFFEGAQ